jgi:excisionase family DNA binding protein
MEPVTTSIAGTIGATGLGRTKIYELINAGRLKTIKIGRRTLVRTDSIRQLLEAA